MKFEAIIFVLSGVISIGVYCEVDVWLTITSKLLYIRGDWRQRLIELNWRNAENDTNDWIGLFNEEIADTVKLSKALLVIQANDRDGKHRTDIEFPVHIFNKEDVARKCLGFYIVYARMKNVLAKNCIKLNPTWMEENFELVRDRRITDLMIPGTHNSAAYYEGYKDTGIVQGVIDNYAICQDENVFNQLMYGIRYLDLRVMYYPQMKNEWRPSYHGIAPMYYPSTRIVKKQIFWMAHDKYQMNQTLATVLMDIRKFLDITSKEVVIIDFHRFPYGFDSKKAEKHKVLLKLVKNFLGPYLSTRQYYDVTVSELVDSGKRVIVGYAEHEINRPNFLYPRVRQVWGDTDNIDRLHEFLAENVCIRMYSSLAEAAMAELTPQTSGIVFNSYGGLRTLADDVNGKVTKWFRDEWATCANIVATDFFLGNNIIEVSINSLKREG